MFADPEAAFNNVRQPILGYDVKDGGFGVLRGLPYWNVDMSLKKQFKITERFSTEFQVIFTNVFNHDQLGDPTGDYLDTSNAAGWGVLPWNGYFHHSQEHGVWHPSELLTWWLNSRAGTNTPSLFFSPIRSPFADNWACKESRCQFTSFR